MKNQITLILIIAFVQLGLAQNEFTKVSLFNLELNGLHFNAKIDYKPDCGNQAPFIRATLHSIEVEFFDYDGVRYNGDDIKGIKFPIKIREGNLDIETYLELGYNGLKINLNKGFLSTSIGGRGSAFMVDEFRVPSDGVKKIKEYLKVSGCTDLLRNEMYKNAHLGGAEYDINKNFKVTGGDLRYTKPGGSKYDDVSLKSYLIDLIKNQFNKKKKIDEVMNNSKKYLNEGYSLNEYKQIISKVESLSSLDLDKSQSKDVEERLNKLKEYLNYSEKLAIEKKYEYLKRYKSFSYKKSTSFYKEGLKKVTELINKTKNSEEKNYLKPIANVIKNNLDSAMEKEISKSKLDAELKRDENKRKMSKIRLSKEEIKRLNNQRLYSNNVNRFKSKGFDTKTAHEMAQNESKIKMTNEIGKKISNTIAQFGTDLIFSAYDRKEKEYNKNWATFEAYKKAFENKIIDLNKATKNKKQAISDLPMTKKMSDNVTDLKQEVLWYVNSHLNGYDITRFEYPSGWGSVISYGKIITKSTVDDAYFEGNKLFVQVTKKCLDASYDMDNLKRSNIKKQSPEPAKFILITQIEYDLNSGTTKTSKNIFWVGKGYYPSKNTFVNNETFKIKLKRLNKAEYAIPGSGKTYLNNTITKRLHKIRKTLKQEEIKSLKTNITFISNFESSVQRDLDNYYEKITKSKPKLIKSKGYYTTNPNEVATIVFWNNRYMIMSTPGKKLFKKMNPNAITKSRVIPLSSSKGFTAKISSKKQTFYPSQFASNYSIGGYSGVDLLISKSNKNSFNKNIYYFNFQNRLASESHLSEKMFGDIWNPYIEIGDTELYIEYEYIKDENIIKQLKKKGVKNLPATEYRKEPKGIVLKLKPLKIGMLTPMKQSNYQYVKAVKTNKDNTKKSLLYYKPSMEKNMLVLKYYKHFLKEHYLPMEKLFVYKPLSYVSDIYYSDILLNGNYKKFKNTPIGDIVGAEFSKNGYAKSYYKMFSYLNQIDFSEEGIKYNGRTPSFYSNGKLKSLGVLKDGKEAGEWEYYDINEKLIKTIKYNHYYPGRKDDVYVFNKKGIQIYEENYDYKGILEYIRNYNPETGTIMIIEYWDGIKGLEDVYMTSKNKMQVELGIFPTSKHIETREFEDGILIKTTKH